MSDASNLASNEGNLSDTKHKETKNGPNVGEKRPHDNSGELEFFFCKE